MKKLALLGGEKSVSCETTDFTLPVVAEESYGVIEGILRRGEISFSEVVTEFEKKFAAYIGTRYAFCLPNGTTAIQAALFGAGIGPGDEVIVPSFTFWATVGPVVVNNAIPIFADVDPDSYNLTGETIEKYITPRTKAILLVHVWGVPCDMDSIMAVAAKYGLKVIEDCSHAHGAIYHEKKWALLVMPGVFLCRDPKYCRAAKEVSL